MLIKPIFKKIKGTSSCQVVVLLEAEGKFRTGGQNLGLPSLSFLRDRRPKKKIIAPAPLLILLNISENDLFTFLCI